MSETQSTSVPPNNLVLYDGVCGLCDRFVQSLLKSDKEQALYFAPLQGTTAQIIRQQHPKLPETLSTVAFLKDGTLLIRSRAVFAIWKQLGGGWRVLAAFRVLPAFLTDLGYRFVAALRYKIWGKKDSCSIPAHADAARFLE
jgi:predicted DCC family thiol-disulfide oxidoreductase YuxK